MLLIIKFSLLVLIVSCNSTPIKGIPRPKVPICLVNVENPGMAICGYDDKEDEFEIESRLLIGTTGQGYNDAERYINLLENKIRSYQRRCKR